MTSNRSDDPMARLANAVNAVEVQLMAMVADLEEMHRKIISGALLRDGDLGYETARKTQAIREWLRIAKEVEMRFEKRDSRHGGGHGPATDLDEARTQVGCRLDRLRRARCPGRFPGGTDGA